MYEYICKYVCVCVSDTDKTMTDGYDVINIRDEDRVPSSRAKNEQDKKTTLCTYVLINAKVANKKKYRVKIYSVVVCIANGQFCVRYSIIKVTSSLSLLINSVQDKIQNKHEN